MIVSQVWVVPESSRAAASQSEAHSDVNAQLKAPKISAVSQAGPARSIGHAGRVGPGAPPRQAHWEPDVPGFDSEFAAAAAHYH